MADEADAAISILEAAHAFSGLRCFKRLILAVSGGPDSLALMLLAAALKKLSPSEFPELSVATVDHGLRPQSAGEARFVTSVSRNLGLPHATLSWDGDKPDSGIAEAARNARYRLLDEFARSFGECPVAVVCAHHADDQAETFAMRLARGAGVDGLASMRSERPLLPGSSVVLARPFLGFSKQRLAATLENHGLTAIQDPTNDDPLFERVRVRRVLPALEQAGVSAKALAISARRLGDARDALDYAERRFAETLNLSYGNEVFGSFDRAAFAAGPAYLRQKLLARLLQRYGGASPAARLSEVENLAASLEGEEKRTVTLGGAVASAGNVSIKIWREQGRLQAADMSLAPGQSAPWDKRFTVECGESAPTSVLVRPLGEVGFSRVAGDLPTRGNPPARAAYALPAFWSGEDLLAVPSLSPFATNGFSRWAPPMFRVRPIFEANN